jgi:hypothetical protein
MWIDMNKGKKEKQENNQHAGQGRKRRFRVIVAVGLLFAAALLSLTLLPFAVEWPGERYLAEAGDREAYINGSVWSSAIRMWKRKRADRRPECICRFKNRVGFRVAGLPDLQSRNKKLVTRN